MLKKHLSARHRRGVSYNKSSQKVHKKQISAAVQLVILEGKEVTKAPKIYENQIFRDVYDKEGNHDRMLDTSNLKELEPKVIFQWKTESTENSVIKPALNLIKPIQNIQDLIKLPGLGRHSLKKAFFS